MVITDVAFRDIGTVVIWVVPLFCGIVQNLLFKLYHVVFNSKSKKFHNKCQINCIFLEGETLDMLLTDASCTEDFLEEAKNYGAFAVSSEWLIQAIISGRKPDAESHQKYRYDYVEPRL